MQSHQLSNGLYVFGRSDQYKESRTPTMLSKVMPYTGCDIKKSGELGKMVEGHRYSFKGTSSFEPQHSGSFNSNSGPQKPSSNSGPQRKTSGPLSGTGTLLARTSFGPQAPFLPATGLITSGPIKTSGSINSRPPFGPLDHKPFLGGNSNLLSAVTNLSNEKRMEYSFSRSVLRAILCTVVSLFLMGFIVGGFILGAVKNPILFIYALKYPALLLRCDRTWEPGSLGALKYSTSHRGVSWSKQYAVPADCGIFCSCQVT